MFPKKSSTFIDMEKIVILGLMVLLSVPFASSSSKTYKVVCYFSSWAYYRSGEGKFVVEDIDPALCTHLVYAFAALTDNKITANDLNLDLTENYGLGSYERFNNLRQSNPDLKTLIAIGGWAEGSTKYSQMASTPASRKTFVDSCVAFLSKHKFNGLDLQWTYPAQRGGRPEDKGNFALLVKELRTAFRTHGFLLTAALSPQQYIIDAGYDIPTLAQNLDFISLLTYDFHGGWEKVTGHNAPLNYTARSSRANRRLTVDFGVKYWLSKGAPSEKLILGMPLFGRSFRLQDRNNHGLGAPATGAGTSGDGMNEGMLGYNEICNLLQSGGEWKVVFDRQIQAPYAVQDTQWIGYDNPESIAIKVTYLKKMKLGGGMVWTVDTDGNCDEQDFPLLRAVNDALNSVSREDGENGPSKYCLNPGKVENGRVTYLPGIIGRRTPQDNPEDPEYPEGARLQYVCNSRYILNGLSILTCEKSGEWSSKRPTCTPEEDIFYCDKPKSFPNRIMTYYPPGSASSADIRNIQEFPAGSRLEYSCAEGYRLEGSSSRECASIGMWRPSAPICEIDCGISSKQSDPKITNGNKTEVGEWPWIVGIAVKEGNANRIICGGALITSKAILTAAHCLTDRNSLILYFGKYHRYDKNDDTEVERRQSENIIIHQDYNRDTMNSDIALVTFSPPIRFTKRIKPICLPINAWKTAENLEPTKSGYVTGWGLTERKLPSDELLLAHLPVVTNEACINGYERNGLEISITTNMYCAGFAEGGQNVCKGDSGSPMVFYDEYKEKYTIEGLVSFSLRGQCGQPERYSIFTKVFQFVPWILSKTKIN